MTVPVIAIDGPSASGKGTIAKRVAQRLGFHYLESGALYRLIALIALRQGLTDEAAIAGGEGELEGAVALGIEGAERQAGGLSRRSHRQHHGLAVAHGGDHGRQSDDDGAGPGRGHAWRTSNSNGRACSQSYSPMAATASTISLEQQ